jgi:sugar lactone lactonase YvrE
LAVTEPPEVVERSHIVTVGELGAGDAQARTYIMAAGTARASRVTADGRSIAVALIDTAPGRVRKLFSTQLPGQRYGGSTPNGLALSPDEKTLYVGSTEGKEPFVKSYTLNADGTVASSRIFFDGRELMARTKRNGGFDGLRVDAKGNVWTSGPGGILIISSAGQHLGSILTGRPTANCAFGDADHQTLYITSNESLLRVRTKVKGAGR